MSEVIDALTLAVIKTLTREGFKGAYYAMVGDAIRGVLGNKRTVTSGDIETLSRAIAQAVASKESSARISEEKLREIIREELQKSLRSQGL